MRKPVYAICEQQRRRSADAVVTRLDYSARGLSSNPTAPAKFQTGLLIWYCFQQKYHKDPNSGLGIQCKPRSDCFTPFEPPQNKTNKMACAPSEDSDQPGHPPSLIRVFAAQSDQSLCCVPNG